jgi:hypothetical protein
MGSQASGEKRQLVMVAGAAIIVLAFIVWWGMKNFGPPPDPKKPPEAIAREARWKELAIKAHGDINNLSPEERAAFQKEGGPYASVILRNFYNQSK